MLHILKYWTNSLNVNKCNLLQVKNPSASSVLDRLFKYLDNWTLIYFCGNSTKVFCIIFENIRTTRMPTDRWVSFET